MIARSGHIERQLNQFDEKLEDPSETLTYNECCDIQEKNQTNVMPLNDEIPEIDRFWKLEFIDIQEQPNQINDGEALK
uniref:Bm9245 n=1 Tax=Brugia malayi TaxID=6279 RepID=A0A1I9G126_BRUMA|nr:Bm9245 [Brugia malayi]